MKECLSMKHICDRPIMYGSMKKMRPLKLLVVVAAVIGLCASGMASAADYRGGDRSGSSYRGGGQSGGSFRSGGQSGRSYRGGSQSGRSFRGSGQAGRSYRGRSYSGRSYRGGSYSGRYYGRGGYSGRYYRGGRYYWGYGGPYWDWNFWWYDPFFYPYYYPYNYPYYSPYNYPYNYPYAAPSVPQEYIERPEGETPSESADVWYYCPDSRKYYPYVRECPGGWQTVPAQPPSPPTQQPAAKVIDKLTLRVNFDVDKAVILPGDKAALDKAVDFVKKYPDAEIELDGYTDDSGTEAYNQKLSEKRAEAVKEYLIREAGVDPSRISAIGRGESNPVADNNTAEGRAQNRRVEILILQE
jgi:outer membrane protein OmpA-like peptidoglycan-associated protein